MKMSDAFENSQVIDSYGPYLIYVGGKDIAAFEFSDYAKAAAQAINNHDKLVELNKELVEALESLACGNNRINNMRLRTKAKILIKKAKELNDD